MIYRILIAVLVILCSTKLFKKAAGSLKLTELNMISVIYYYVLILNMIGASLIFIGFRDHYLINKIQHEGIIDKTYLSLSYCVIAFPASVILTRKFLHTIPCFRTTRAYYARETRYNGNMKQIQAVIIAAIGICTLSVIYVFSKLGYNPITAVFNGEDLSVLKQQGGRYFQGNEYIKNIFMSILTPLVSYFTYIYYRITKKQTWLWLLIYIVLLSILVQTYDFQKAPILYYLFGFYLIEVSLGNIRNNKKIIRLVIIFCIIIVMMYVFMLGQTESLKSIYTGPVGRIFFTQIATLFLHFDAFPANHPFLNGASFNSWLSFLIPEAQGMRSGRVVMEIYNAEAVEMKTAGVMNTVFLGEAYANYGTVGIIIAPILFGIIISFWNELIRSRKKTVANILLYTELTILLASIVEGGFIDIIYNAGTIIILFFSFVLYVLSGQNNRIYIGRANRYADLDLLSIK